MAALPGSLSSDAGPPALPPLPLLLLLLPLLLALSSPHPLSLSWSAAAAACPVVSPPSVVT